METVSISRGDALRVFAPHLADAPQTGVRLLFEDLRVEIERAFGDQLPPPGFVQAVRDNAVLLAADAGIALIWVSLDNIVGSIPIDREHVSGPEERLSFLDQILLDAFTPTAWAYKNGGDMHLYHQNTTN